ncbi:MAG: PHB depolymerase family esterase [Desulfosarcinaceae bacterium]|nr:PHB depolymerase family esterase [Desulfosarcinaceae bacterium]
MMGISNTGQRRLLYLPMLALLLSACAGLPPYGPIEGGVTYYRRMKLESAGYQRSYRLHVPPGYRDGNRLPLVVVIHGAFDTAKGIERISGFSRLADRENFIVLYPEGIGIFGLLQHWNAGHCCGKAAADQIDDVGYLAAAIEEVIARLSVDRRRIYMVGFSNGGMLTHRFAAERTDLLAAAVPMAASPGGRAGAHVPEWFVPTPRNPLPMLIIHGLADDDVPFSGGHSLHRGGERTYAPVVDALAFWKAANRCIDPPAESRRFDGRVRTQRWDACSEGAVTALTTIAEWGHVWPGPYFIPAPPADHPLEGFDAAAFIWDFFESLP